MMKSFFIDRFAGRLALPVRLLSLVDRFAGRLFGQLKAGSIC